MREPNPDVDPTPDIGPEPGPNSDNEPLPLDLPPGIDDDAPVRVPPDHPGIPDDDQPDPPPPEGDPPSNEPTRLVL